MRGPAVLRCRVYACLSKDLNAQDIVKHYKEGEGVDIEEYTAADLLSDIAIFDDVHRRKITDEELVTLIETWEERWGLLLTSESKYFD